MGFGLHFAERFQQVFQRHLADLALVGTGLVFHDRDAMFLIAGVPGLDGAPGKLAGVAIQPTDRVQDALLYPTLLAETFDQLQIGIRTSAFDAKIHATVLFLDLYLSLALWLQVKIAG